MTDNFAPVSWRREWDGDVSDLGQYVHADDADDLDHYGAWEALYSEFHVKPLIEAARCLLDACDAVNAAQSRRVIDPHATENVRRALAEHANA